MKISTWLIPMGMGAALAAWAGGTPAAAEPAGHSHERCELHGGTVTMTQNHHFETLFAPDGMRVFVYSAAQTPQMTQEAKGRVVLSFKDGRTQELPLVVTKPTNDETMVYVCPMHNDVVQMKPGNCPKCGMTLSPQDYLFGTVDLSKVEPGALKAMVRIEGLAGPEPVVSFMEAYQGWAKAARKDEGGAPQAAPQGESSK